MLAFQNGDSRQNGVAERRHLTGVPSPHPTKLRRQDLKPMEQAYMSDSTRQLKHVFTPRNGYSSSETALDCVRVELLLLTRIEVTLRDSHPMLVLHV